MLGKDDQESKRHSQPLLEDNTLEVASATSALQIFWQTAKPELEWWSLVKWALLTNGEVYQTEINTSTEVLATLSVANIFGLLHLIPSHVLDRMPPRLSACFSKATLAALATDAANWGSAQALGFHFAGFFMEGSKPLNTEEMQEELAAIVILPALLVGSMLVARLWLQQRVGREQYGVFKSLNSLDAFLAAYKLSAAPISIAGLINPQEEFTIAEGWYGLYGRIALALIVALGVAMREYCCTPSDSSQNVQASLEKIRHRWGDVMVFGILIELAAALYDSIEEHHYLPYTVGIGATLLLLGIGSALAQYCTPATKLRASSDEELRAVVVEDVEHGNDGLRLSNSPHSFINGNTMPVITETLNSRNGDEKTQDSTKYGTLGAGAGAT